LKRVKHYNKPKQYKKYTTFRRKQTDASTLISANNSHDSDNLTINRLSHLFKKTLKTYIPKYELSRLIKKYKNKRRGNKYVMRGGKLQANLEQLIKDYKDSTDSAIKEVKLGEITELVSSGLTAGGYKAEYETLISVIYAEPANTEEKTKLLTLINPARVAEVNSKVDPAQPQSIKQVETTLSNSSQSGKANEAGANQPAVSLSPIAKQTDVKTAAGAEAVQVAESTDVDAAKQNEGNASAQAATDKQSAEGARVPETQVISKESKPLSNTPSSGSANEELDDDVIESEVIELKDASSCKDLLTALLNDREFSYVTVSKSGSEEQIKNKTNFIIGAIRYGRIPKKEESATPAAAVPAEPAAEKSILDFTNGESVSVAAGDPIIKGDGVFINTPIDGTFNGGTADNIDIAGIDKGKFGTITSKRVYKKGKQIERTEDIPKDVTFDDIRVEVNFPPDITEESPDLTQYLYNFSANTSVKIKQTQESCAAFLEKNKDDDKESTKDKMKKVAALLPKIISQPSKFEKFKKLLSDKFTGGIVGFKELFKKREIPLPPEVIDGLKEQTEDSENCTIGATSPDPITLTVTTDPDGTVSIKSSSGPGTLPGLLDSLAKKDEEDKNKDKVEGDKGKNAAGDTANSAKSLNVAGEGEQVVEPDANEKAVSGDGGNSGEDDDDDDEGEGAGAGAGEEQLARSPGDAQSKGNSPSEVPAPVKTRPKDTAALLASRRERKVTQAKTAEEQKLEMTRTAVSNTTSITTPIRPDVDKSLTDYKTIFDNVEKTVNGYLNYDVGKTDSDSSYKPEPSYPLTSFALVFNNNFNWKENVANQEYPISPYNLQSKLPALNRIYETRNNLNEASKKIIDNVRNYVTNIIDQKVRTGGPDANAANQSAFLSEIQKLLQTSEFKDATNKQNFIDRVKNNLGLNINDFYMNEIWTNFIKPYGDLKRFVEAIINTNSIIRKQIDGFIKQNKASNLNSDKQRSTGILTQIENILDNVNTQNGVFNVNILAIAFDLLFLQSLLKRKDIAISKLRKFKEEYEKIRDLLNLANTRISEFFGILNNKKQFISGLKKISTQDNQTIINEFKRLLCDAGAITLYSKDIGSTLPDGELKQNILMLFKLIKDSFEKECAKCSTLLNCSGPKLQTFLENSKKIKGLIDGIIRSVNREISDLESKINNVIKTPEFSFDLYGVNTTFTDVNFDKVKAKIDQTTSQVLTDKLDTQIDATQGDAPETKTQIDIYTTALKGLKSLLPSLSVNAFNGVSMDKLSEGSIRAAAAAAAAEAKTAAAEAKTAAEAKAAADANAAASRRNIDAAAAADADKWWADKRKKDKAAKANLAATSAASSLPIAPGSILSAGENAAASNIEAVVVDKGADADADADANADANAHAHALQTVDIHHVDVSDLNDEDGTHRPLTNNSPASPAGNKFGTVGGKTRRNNPKTKNKQTRKQNKVIYRIPHKSSSYKSKIGTTNSAKSKNTRKHK